ncbi:hypothetical protein QTG54_008317 [Skeletonema marinoi]|uniref:Uncharacterized protein n=1 Tax=Skeletonema marinoi TaxID=267567 RepID=A0AAD8Y9R5_9STRA|nr:hypothetical protein QTG54_008317 [Skeletonema marinoi]
MDPPAADKYLSRSTSSSRLWRSSKNAPVTGIVKGERQRLNYRRYCSQNGQNKMFLHRLCLCVILSALAPFVCFQFYFLYKLTNGKEDATERIAYQLGTRGDAIPEPEISPLDHFVPLPLPAEVPDWIPPNFHEWNYTNSTPPSVWFDALDTYGRRGYVADPTLLRKSVLQWHKDHPGATYWDRLKGYQSHLLKKIDDYLFMEKTCALIPGVSVFGQGGLTMLVERIKLDEVPTLRMGGKDCLKQEETPDADDGNNNTTKKKKLKLFCGVYSYDGQRDSTRLAALSYGIKCDGFLAFSTATIPSLGMVALMHRGNETYQNMFQKTRSILSYVATHYLDDYDYFHLGGDDMHVIVENMRSLMLVLEYEREGYSGNKEGRMFGQLAIKPRAGNLIFTGGPG